MLILSLDPGGTTGVAAINYEEDQAPQIVRTWQIQNGLKGFLDFHWDELEDWNFDEIVCESFTLREGVRGVDLSPTYVIGALEALYPTTTIHYQAPSQKPLCDDERLKKINMHEKARPHANDAVRHAIIYLRNKLHSPTLKLGWS